MIQVKKLVSYYIDKKGRLFEITKENGLIHIHLINQPHTQQLNIASDDSPEIELDILEIP